VIARVAAAIALVGGVAGWAATDRTVTVVVDGAATTVHTHAPDVRALLVRTGATVREHDEVEPALDSAVPDGGHVHLDRGRLLVLTIDGRRREVWVTARSVGDALDRLGISTDRMRMTASRSHRLPLEGMTVDLSSEKRVVLVADRRKSALTTFAATVADLLAERGVQLGSRDRTSVPVASPLPNGATVTVTRIVVRTVTRTATVKAEVQTRKNPAVLVNTEKVLDEGRDGKARQTVEMTYTDGTLVSTRVVAATTLIQPKTRVVEVGSKPFPKNASGLNWAALAQCESGGNPRAVSAGGTYHGLYQFSVSTWQSVGGTGVPSQASADEQTYRAQVLYDRGGAGQWPVCGSKLFT
jgi:uncharacterized protein YabE (DUF348 family)